MSAPYRRVVITGMGALTPLGNSAAESFSAALEGKSGIAKITHFDASAFPVQFAGEVKNFNLDEYIPKKEQKKMDRFIHLALAATAQAVKDCGIEWSEELKDRTGVFLGVGMGGLPLIEETHETLRTRGPGRISPFFIPQVIANMAAGHISINYGFRGPN
ncbi:MAG: beta-ketoacyl synthase N-terminal-like domain-containing protein, partial [Bdellovibrionota bacterium]